MPSRRPHYHAVGAKITVNSKGSTRCRPRFSPPFWRGFIGTSPRQMRYWLYDASHDQIFTNRVTQWGVNLVNAGNVLQISVHQRGDSVWIVRAEVGALMKGVSYILYLELTIGSNSFEATCECLAGYVFHIGARVCVPSLVWFLTLFPFYFSANHCSHVAAVILRLETWVSKPDQVHLVWWDIPERGLQVFIKLCVTGSSED
jgi:hypothetical protein